MAKPACTTGWLKVDLVISSPTGRATCLLFLLCATKLEYWKPRHSSGTAKRWSGTCVHGQLANNNVRLNKTSGVTKQYYVVIPQNSSNTRHGNCSSAFLLILLVLRPFGKTWISCWRRETANLWTFHWVLPCITIYVTTKTIGVLPCLISVKI